jgi:WD40 repeat protein
MPRGAKSCFAGSVKLRSSGPELLLHLYNVDPVNDFKGKHENDSLYHFAVDVFEVKTTRHTKSKSYHFTKHFPLKYRGWPWPPNRFGAQLLWLDPKERRQPIIDFQCISTGGYTSGFHVLAVFAGGLRSEPHVQSFIFGAWRASGSSGASVSFDSVDEAGRLQIRTQEYLDTSEIPPPPPVTFRWTGKEFKPIQPKDSSSAAPIPAAVATPVATPASATSHELVASTRTWNAHPRGLTAMAFDSSGRRLAAAGDEGVVKVWNTRDGTLISQTPARVRRIFGLLWSPDEQSLLTVEAPRREDPPRPTDTEINTGSRFEIRTEHADRDNGISLWNAQTGALEKEWREPNASLFTVSFTPDGTLVVAGRSPAAPFVQWREFPSGQVRYELPILAHAISPDGQRFAAVTQGLDYLRTLYVTTASQGRTFDTKTIALRNLSVNDVVFSNDNRFLLAASNDSFKTMLWDATTLHLVRAFSFEGNPTTQLLLPHTPLVVTIGKRRPTQFFDLTTGTYLGRAKEGGVGAISRDGRFLATAPVSNRYTVEQPDWRGDIMLDTLRTDLEYPARLPTWSASIGATGEGVPAAESTIGGTTAGGATSIGRPLTAPLPTGEQLSGGFPLLGASLVGLDQSKGDLIAMASRIGPFAARDEDQLLGWNWTQRTLIPVFDLKGEKDHTGRGIYHTPLALSADGRRIAVSVPAEGVGPWEIANELHMTRPNDVPDPDRTTRISPVVRLEKTRANSPFMQQGMILHRGTFSNDGTWFAAWASGAATVTVPPWCCGTHSRDVPTLSSRQSPLAGTICLDRSARSIPATHPLPLLRPASRSQWDFGALVLIA